MIALSSTQDTLDMRMDPWEKIPKPGDRMLNIRFEEHADYIVAATVKKVSGNIVTLGDIELPKK